MKWCIMPSMAQRKPKAAGDSPWPDRLKAIRKHYKLSQRAAAEKIGAVLHTWQNWEYGRSAPTAATARLIEITFPMPSE